MSIRIVWLRCRFRTLRLQKLWRLRGKMGCCQLGPLMKEPLTFDRWIRYREKRLSWRWLHPRSANTSDPSKSFSSNGFFFTLRAHVQFDEELQETILTYKLIDREMCSTSCVVWVDSCQWKLNSEKAKFAFCGRRWMCYFGLFHHHVTHACFLGRSCTIRIWATKNGWPDGRCPWMWSDDGCNSVKPWRFCIAKFHQILKSTSLELL